MRTILFILQKEFLQIFRNKTMLPMIFVLPIVQLIILANATTQEIKNINVVVLDNDYSGFSRGLITKIGSTDFFRIVKSTNSYKEASDLLKEDKATVILNIPQGFEKKLVREGKQQIQLIVNAINGTVAGVSNSYLLSIVSEYNKNIVIDWYKMPKLDLGAKEIDIRQQFWFNPELDYKIYMVPGILVILITVIGMFLSSLNLVREKEIGTTEQINVTPIKKYQFIIGKLLPFLIIGLVELSVGLIIGKLLYDVPFIGNIFDLYVVAFLYLLVVLGVGLFVSVGVDTQQQAMFVLYFFIMVFILMSGIFTATESMPDWAQWINKINPVYYFMRAIRMIMLKGSSLKDILPEITSLGVLATLMLGLAVIRYRKTN